jgi:hypothetical protein
MSDINSASYLANLYDENYEDVRLATILGQLSSAIASIAAFTLFADHDGEPASNYAGRAVGAKTKKRKRRDMDDYLGSMDPKLFRRKYRMDKSSFYRLLDIIEDRLPRTGEKRSRGATPNGPITKAARLSMALRYCAGGDPLDIADLHGVNPDEVTNSLWSVVDAIHESPQLDIKFPETYEEQMGLAQGFRQKSAIDISCCVGAIDGILIWTHRPSERDVKVIKFGSTKFFCGRKMKYGLNMMAVCDSRGRFTWVEARFPGAASDYYAFEDSHLKRKLEVEGFLRPGLCLFGDNAYVNSPFMCTPWRNVSAGPKRMPQLLPLSTQDKH